MNRRIAGALMLAAAIGAPAWAQDTATPQEVRPAITTFWGDTGLWFVPTAEILKPGGWAFGAYRTEQDYTQGTTDAAFYPVTFAVGAGHRMEIFGAVRAVTSLDRDTRPLFNPAASTNTGGLVNDYPLLRSEWSGNKFGDVYVGTKFNLMSQHRRQPMALAFRATVKVPTASDNNVGTGEFDYLGDIIVSKEVTGVELSGYSGYVFRGDPNGLSTSDGVRWGVGAAFGPRSTIRFTTELYGEAPSDSAVRITTRSISGVDGSVPPSDSHLESPVNGAAGLTWQHKSGTLLGIGATYRFGLEDRRGIGLQLRLGFHSGVRIFTPPPPVPPPAPPRVEAPPPAPAPVVAAAPAPAPPPAPVPPPNRAPTVRADCDPCRIEVGQSVTIRATTADPDGDAVRARWSVPAGTITDPLAATTQWRAETAPGPVVLTVSIEDGRGGTASSTVTIEVMPLRVLADVQFDLDKSTLRPDALSVLTTALKALNDLPTMRLHIEGYASPEGSPDYNKALGERRATAVRDYLTSKGVDASRLTITSYGEERLKYDTSQEASRALNRRAALVID